MWRRTAVGAGALLALPVALALAVLAVDVLRVPATLEAGDVRFDAAPARQHTPWNGLDFLRGWPAKRLLDVGDDLAFRRAMVRFLRVAPGRDDQIGPRVENLKGEVRLELTALSAEDANRKRRSRALNLLAAMSLERYSSDAVEAQNTLRKAIFMFRSAVELDPDNEDAKLNLELALRNAKATNLPGTDPTGDAAVGSISGQGRAGSGY